MKWGNSSGKTRKSETLKKNMLQQADEVEATTSKKKADNQHVPFHANVKIHCKYQCKMPPLRSPAGTKEKCLRKQSDLYFAIRTEPLLCDGTRRPSQQQGQQAPQQPQQQQQQQQMATQVQQQQVTVSTQPQAIITSVPQQQIVTMAVSLNAVAFHIQYIAHAVGMVFGYMYM